MPMATQRPPSKTLKWLRARPWVQAAFLAVWLDPLFLRLHNVCGVAFHCYACPLALFACPIGVIANFSSLHLLPLLAVGTLLLVGAAVGAFVCGWACPFGFLQDLLSKVPTPRFNLPHWTGYLRYAVLALFVLLVPYLWGEAHSLFICRLCPAGTLEAALPAMAKTASSGGSAIFPSTTRTVIAVLLVVALFFTHRPWCVMFCPLGALFGLTNRFSAFFLRYDPSSCINCSACRKLCRYGVAPDLRANDPRCIRCLECTRCGALTVGSALSSKP